KCEHTMLWKRASPTHLIGSAQAMPRDGSKAVDINYFKRELLYSASTNESGKRRRFSLHER
ncbi:MAG: hypothetical protein AB7D07_08110, partial [Desulfovibrionaceae bacterium]